MKTPNERYLNEYNNQSCHTDIRHVANGDVTLELSKLQRVSDINYLLVFTCQFILVMSVHNRLQFLLHAYLQTERMPNYHSHIDRKLTYHLILLITFGNLLLVT